MFSLFNSEDICMKSCLKFPSENYQKGNTTPKNTSSALPVYLKALNSYVTTEFSSL